MAVASPWRPAGRSVFLSSTAMHATEPSASNGPAGERSAGTGGAKTLKSSLVVDWSASVQVKARWQATPAQLVHLPRTTCSVSDGPDESGHAYHVVNESLDAWTSSVSKQYFFISLADLVELT